MVQLGNLDEPVSDPPEPHSSHGARLRHQTVWRIVIGLAALILLLVTLPSLPAAWRGLINFSSIGDGASGNVVVHQCQRGELLVDWTCQGTWSPNDPMATPVQPEAVTVANNSRHLSAGTELGYVSLNPATHEGFNAGAKVQLPTLALWLGVLCGLATLVLLVTTRGRRILWPSVVTLALACLLIGSAWSLVTI
jgi:hypothetical protein